MSPVVLTKVIYLASPYTGKSWFGPLNFLIKLIRYLKITSITGKLQDKYSYAFIGPITQSHHTIKYMSNKTSSFSAWKTRDLSYISRCDEVWVVMMPGWEASTGVREEIDFALSLRRCPVRYLDPKTLKFTRAGKVWARQLNR